MGGQYHRKIRVYMSVDYGACSFNRSTVLFNLRLKTFLQKREAALLAKSYDGNGKPRTGKYLPPVPNAHK